MDWYLKVLRHYADFKGRARRKEFWMFILISGIISWLTVALDYALGTNFEDYTTGIFNIIYALVILIPYLAVTVRRLHDIGKSGWMFLIILIPFAGPIWLIVLWATDSEPGENKYGPNPKEDKGDNKFEADSDKKIVEDKNEAQKKETGENEIKEVENEVNDSISSVFIAFFTSAFIGCAGYALLSITKIVDGFQNAERIKNVVLIVLILISFILLLISKPKQVNRSESE